MEKVSIERRISALRDEAGQAHLRVSLWLGVAALDTLFACSEFINHQDKKGAVASLLSGFLFGASAFEAMNASQAGREAAALVGAQAQIEHEGSGVPSDC